VAASSSSQPAKPPLFTSRPARPYPAFAHEGAGGADAWPARHDSILIVEDDFLIASQMEIALKDAGFEVAGIAVSGGEALERAAAHRPMLCIMDIRLFGRSDGVDAALELFRTHGIRCIFATAHSDDDVRRRAAAAKPLGWLPKPYTMASLVALVRQAVSEIQHRAD
jgi:two-component system, response regulator PdtaR